MKRVVIADKHPVTIEGIKALLESKNEYSIVDSVSRGSELLLSLQKECPDVLILELDIPEINGFQAIRSIRDEFPKMKIVVFSSHPEEIYAIRSIKSGASAYIPKIATGQILLEAIKQVLLDNVFSNEQFSTGYKNKSKNTGTVAGLYKKLSAREIEVLSLLSNGKRNKEIASLLEINEKTVSTYKTRLLKKLKVSNLADLIKQNQIFQYS